MTPDAASTADAALEALARAADQLDRIAAAASEGINGWWAGVIGADSTLAALRTNATATRTLLETMRAKRARLSTDAEAADFVATINANTDTGLSVKIADGLTPAGAVREVGGDTLKDLGNAAAGVGAGWLAVLKASPFLVAGLLLAVAWSWGRRRG